MTDAERDAFWKAEFDRIAAAAVVASGEGASGKYKGNRPLPGPAKVLQPTEGVK
jgi:hypothetical protein